MRLRFLGLASVMACLLSACGGGGDAPAAVEAPASPSAQVVALSAAQTSSPGLHLATQSLTLTQELGDDAPEALVEGEVSQATAPVYVFVQYTNKGLTSVQFSQTSANGGRLRVVGMLATQAGEYNDEIRVDVCYDRACAKPVAGSPQSVQVTHHVVAPQAPAAILPSRYGVALAQVPSGQHLAHSVRIDLSGANPGNWVATANVPWLKVTSSGAAGAQLNIEAQPDGLAPNRFYPAEVLVTPAVSGAARPAVIRVGLYLGTQPSVSAFDVPVGGQVHMDPARPLVYSLSDDQVQIDHVHTGRRLLAAGIPGVHFGNMALSPDGATLVLVDADRKRVWLFDTDHRVFRGVVDLPAPGPFIPGDPGPTPFVVKANGRDMLLVLGILGTDLQLHYHMRDLNTGYPVTEGFRVNYWQYDRLTQAADPSRFMLFTGLSPNSLRWGRFTENSKGRVVVTDLVGGTFGSGHEYLNTDFFVDAAGRNVISCQGIFYPSTSPSYDWVDIDHSLIDSFSWSLPGRPDYGNERLNKQCAAIEPYGDDDQFLMTDSGAAEFQIRRRDGSLVNSWTNTVHLQGTVHVTSDLLRVFGDMALVDIPPAR